MIISWEEREILLVVKSYPVRSEKYGNTVCTAGILEDTYEWVRIYPIRWIKFAKENLQKFVRFKAKIMKNPTDKRRESYKIRERTIEIIDTSLTDLKVKSLQKRKNIWEKRIKILSKCVSNSMETLHERYRINWTSLGMIKPNTNTLDFLITKKIYEIEINVEESTQYSITGEKLMKVDKIENVFKYKFNCNNPECNGHIIICEDWELLQAFRDWRIIYKSEDLEKNLKKKFLDFMINKRELYFIVGTHYRFPTWLIIGLFYPPKQPRLLTLMDFIKN